ncbi:MAG: DUF4625 domain-containing protein [Flavobacteriaceae bacterium]|nr:DUF4625 domain-containing protein [Flavobacteriaceae bacterium]
MVKKLFSGILISFAILSLVVVSCSDDDNFDDSILPGFPDFPTSISSAPGYEFVFEGLISDELGIETVEMSYSKWFLDKTIEFDDTPKEYLLKYKFLVPQDEEAETSHTIKVSVKNLAGNITTHDVIITLDMDVIAPVIEFISPVVGTSYVKGETVEIDINFSDDKGLDSIMVSSDLLGLDYKNKITDGSKETNYPDTIEIPADGVDGVVFFDAVAIDKEGNRTSKTVSIIVGEKDEIAEVYAVGGSMWWEWDVSKATRMWKDPDNEDWFVLEFYYWTDYGIKFVGQLGWEPSNWGLDPNDNSKMINSQDSQEINFDLGDGYYRVKFNPYTLEYTYELMTVDVEVKDSMYIVGNGYPDYPGLDWNPDGAIKMDPDGWGNPYVFSAWIQISDDTSLKFIGQNDGWEPYDCGFVEGGEVQFPVNYVKNKAGSGSNDLKFKGQAGWYWVQFDYFLLRTTIHLTE